MRADAKKAPALQHGEIAMDQPRRGRRRGGAEIVPLQQDDPQAPARGIARFETPFSPPPMIARS
jgi:hypothetical protein